MGFDTSITLEAKPRTEKGKNASRRLRAAGMVPVTVYGSGDAATGAVSKREIATILRKHGRNQIFTLKINGEATTVKIAEMQFDPLRGSLLHADLMRISLTEKTEFDVSVHVTGEPEGVRLQGGLLDLPLHSLRVRCLPRDLPSAIEVDVAALKIGNNLRVRDLQLPEGVEVLTDPDVVLANVIAPKAEEEVTAAAPAEAVAEPEVIKKGKQEEKGPEK
ncbi:MAG TPA: 50S ribosomal protein L25 [Blastocatellia bacterium]|nr:50S ribosomal protein L25 [Blastocatellia bacterium]